MTYIEFPIFKRRSVKKVMFSVMAVLLGFSLWLAPATAQQWILSATTVHGSSTSKMAFASDGSIFHANGAWISKWDIINGHGTGLKYSDTKIKDMVIPADDPYFFAYTVGDEVHMRYTADRSFRSKIISRSSGDVDLLAISANGKRLVAARNAPARLEVWDVSTTIPRILRGSAPSDQDYMYDIAIDTDGNYMFVTDGNTTDERKTSSGAMNFRYNSLSTVTALAYESGYIASGCENGVIDLWDYNAEKYVRSFLGASDQIFSVAFSIDGRYLAAAAMDGAYVWEVRTGRLLSTLRGHANWVTAIAFSPSGHIVTGTNGLRTRFWRKSDVENPITRLQTTLDESKRKLDSATLIDGLRIDKSRMKQQTSKGAVVEDSFWYYGNNHFLLLDQFKSTCGTTSAEMVLHYYGKDVGQGDIWGENGLLNLGIDDILGGGAIHTVEVGSFPREIEQALNRLGVPAVWYHRGSLAHLRGYVSVNRPPIILLRFGDSLHYVVVVGYNTGGDFLIADPNNVFRWLTSAEMQKGWSLDRPGLSVTRYKVRGVFKEFGLAVLAPFVDVLTGGENMIVPKFAPTRHFPENRSELEAIVVTGGDDFNPNWNTRAWERTLDFSNNFADYRLSTTTPTSVSNLWNIGLDSAWVTKHDQIAPNKVKVWGRATYGKWTRGKVWVFVRAYRNEKDGLVAAAPAANLSDEFPTETSLLSNYPNPFNPETWIPYQLVTPAEVRIEIYSVDGKLIRTLELGQLPAGVYADKTRAAYWDGRNGLGEAVASGVYFYTLKAGDFSATKKMLVMK